MKMFSLSPLSRIAGLLTAALMLFAPAAFSSDILRVDGTPVISTKTEAAVTWRSAPDPGNTTAVTFTPLNESVLKNLQEENSGLWTKRIKIGVTRNTETDAAARFSGLNWQNTGDGYAARFAVTSPNAKALRVALLLYAFPNAAELRFSGSAATEKVIGVVTGKEANSLRDEHGVYWTPMTDGETQTIELFLPAGTPLESVRIGVDAASHIFVSAQEELSPASVLKASQYCEIDVICKYSSLGNAFQNTAKAVARMVFTKSGNSYLCTGTLLNDTARSQTPYFWSAAHCISTQTVASTLNTFWFDEVTSCGGSTRNSNYRQLSGGAQLLHVNASADTLLLSLNNSAPAGAWLAGWDASRFSSGSMIGIHHPNGDYKKVSVGSGPGRTCDTIFATDPSSPVNNASLTAASWSEGSTEGGSSGSGLFTLSSGQYYLRGGLQGGAAECSNSGRPLSSGNVDCYSRLDLVYDDIKKYLSPSSSTPGPTREYTGQWVKADENAWGLTVLLNFSSNSRYIFVPWYTYDASGKASWYIFQGDSWTANDTISADVVRYTGPAWGAMPYDNSRISNTKVGTAKLTFTSATTATFTYTVEGASRTINLTKFE